MRDMTGQVHLKRALVVAAAGGHHMLLFGPSGSGKTLGAKILEGLLPDLNPALSHEVSRIWLQAGRLPRGEGMITAPPFRMPCHSASMESFFGGGRPISPGEISLAHGGILFLDKTTEFRLPILRSLRFPLENGQVTIVREGQFCWFPSRFQLVMAFHPCPCGNMGRGDSLCLCSDREISRHWEKIDGFLMNRIDIRMPVEPVTSDKMTESMESSAELKERIAAAVQRQSSRYENKPFYQNRDIPEGLLKVYCPLDPPLKDYFICIARKLSLSSRACHSVLKVSRTIADLRGGERIKQEDLEEAVQYRRYGDRSLFWSTV